MYIGRKRKQASTRLRLGPLGPGKPYQKSSKIHSKSMQNFTKILPKSTPNSPKIHLELSWAVLAASWAILAPRGPQERNKTEKPELGPPLPERIGSTSCKLMHQGLHWTRQLGSTWTQLGPTWVQLGPTWPYLRRFSMDLESMLTLKIHQKSLLIVEAQNL